MPRHTRRTAAAAAAEAADAHAKTAEAEPAQHAEPAAKRAKTKPAPEPIAVGDKIPEGEVVNQDGKPVNLARDYAKGIVALYAYPRASTPGCTRQTIGFGEAFAELTELGVTVFGISADSPNAQTTFQSKTGIKFDLLSDPEYTLLEPLGAKKSPKGVIRSHWVFNDGKVVLVEHQVKPDASPKRVVDTIKSAITTGPDGSAVGVDETPIENDSASGKPETAKELAAAPLEKLSDGDPADETAEETAEEAAEPLEPAPPGPEPKKAEADEPAADEPAADESAADETAAEDAAAKAEPDGEAANGDEKEAKAE